VLFSEANDTVTVAKKSVLSKLGIVAINSRIVGMLVMVITMSMFTLHVFMRNV
jgi:hypothetical protein